MNIAELPLLTYSVTICAPSATKKQKEKEARLTQEAGAEKGTIKVSQEKIPARWMKPLQSSQNAIRLFFERNAFRLNDGFSVPISEVERFEKGLEKLVREHDVHVQALCDAIASGEIIQEAMRRAGTDFNPELLPSSCEQIRDAIKIVVSRRTDLSSPVISKALGEIAEETRARVEKQVKEDAIREESEGQASIVGFIMGEVVDYLKDTSERCDVETKGKHYQTLVDKFRRITEKLPAYNVTGNPVVAKAIARVFDVFKDMDKETLSKSLETRKETAQKAKNLLQELEGESLF